MLAAYDVPRMPATSLDREDGMLEQLDDLVSRFERGQLARRDFLVALAALKVGLDRSIAPALFPARNITHVNVRVRDVAESERFYRELFGLPRARDVVGAARALDLPGGGFVSLCALSNPGCGMTDPATPGEIDHFGLGVGNFRREVIARQLEQRGLETFDAGSSVFLKDPNGAWLQLSTPNESFRE